MELTGPWRASTASLHALEQEEDLVCNGCVNASVRIEYSSPPVRTIGPIEVHTNENEIELLYKEATSGR